MDAKLLHCTVFVHYIRYTDWPEVAFRKPVWKPSLFLQFRLVLGADKITPYSQNKRRKHVRFLLFLWCFKTIMCSCMYFNGISCVHQMVKRQEWFLTWGSKPSPLPFSCVTLRFSKYFPCWLISCKFHLTIAMRSQHAHFQFWKLLYWRITWNSERIWINILADSGSFPLLIFCQYLAATHSCNGLTQDECEMRHAWSRLFL